MTKKIRIGALISGGGTNLQAIVDACRDGRINGRIVFVGSDNPGADGLARARRDNIPTFVVDYNSIIRAAKAELDQVELPDDLAAGRHGLHLKAADEAGNEAEADVVIDCRE